MKIWNEYITESNNSVEKIHKMIENLMASDHKIAQSKKVKRIDQRLDIHRKDVNFQYIIKMIKHVHKNISEIRVVEALYQSKDSDQFLNKFNITDAEISDFLSR